MSTIPANQLVPASALPEEINAILPLLGIKDYKIRWQQNGLEMSIDLDLPDAELTLDFGGENGFSAVFEELVRLELTLADALEIRVELERMFLRLPSLFKPAILQNNSWIIHENSRVEIPFNGILRIDHDMNILPGLDPITIEPFTIDNTNIFLSLTNCKIILAKPDIPAELLALDQTDAFRGIYATEAVFQWLPELQIAGLDVPGLRLTFQNIALGNSGVSFDLQQDFIVEHNETDFLPSTELKGFLFNEDWAIALSSVGVSMRNNIPNSFSIGGVIHIAMLNSFFETQFGINRSVSGHYLPSLSIFKSNTTPISIDLGVGEMSITQLGLNGLIQEGGFALDGLFNGSLNLSPITVSVEQAQFSLSHAPEKDEFNIELNQVQLGPLGQIEQATLNVVFEKSDDSDERQISILLETKLSWQDLHSRLNLDNVPDEFPRPPDDAEVTLYLLWQEDGKFTLRFATAIPEPESLWPFIPAEFQPDIRNLILAFEANYENVSTLNNASSSSTFEGKVAVELEMRFPEIGDLPGADLFVFENNWLKARLETGLRTSDSGDDEVFMSLSIADPISFGIQFPGLAQTQPPIQVAITTIDFDLQASGSDNTSGHFTLSGDFKLRPINPAESNLPVPPFMASQMEKMFQQVNFSDINGKATFDLQFKNNKAAMSLICEFTDAAIELDLFDMISGLTRGLPTPQNSNDAENTIDLDIEVGIQLSKIAIQLGSIEESSSTQSQFSFELMLDFSFAGFMAENFSFKLSDQEFSFGFEKLEIPIALPHFPISLDDLNQLRDATDQWDYPGLWLTDTEPVLTDAISTLKNEVNALKNQLEGLEDGNRAIQDQLRQKRKILFEKSGKKFLIESIFAIHQIVGESNRGNYQTQVEWYMRVMDATLHQFSFDTQLYFVLRDVRFVLPFQDPSNLRVEGGAQISGFNPNDPMAPLGDMVFKIGLSAEAIFFSVEGGDPIPIPAFGYYTNEADEQEAKVSVALNHARFGYGYSKNALHIDVAGQFKIAPDLADTLDTSDVIGAGIRLPEQSRLAFKLDLIPITLGEVDFLLPLFEFDIDLRKDFSPGLVSSEKCEPYWDGLQIIVPNIIREDFKRMHFAPFWGPLLAPNYVFSFDLMLGDENNGLTHICDDYKVISPVLTSSASIPIPFLADGMPFFDNLCLNVRLAGFAVNFNLQRPYPSLSPLAFFEIFGLIADPMMPVDPDGALASTIRISLKNASIKLPPAVVSMFPEHGTFLNQEINYTINLGTLITIAQAIGGQVGDFFQNAKNATDNFMNLLEDAKNNPPDLSPEALLAQLPPELRSFQVNGSFIGFDASATFVLLSQQQAQSEFEKRTLPGDLNPARVLFEENFTTSRITGWKVANDTGVRSKWIIRNKEWRQIALTRGSTHQIYQQTFDNCIFTTRLQSDANQEIGVVFGYQNTKNYYRFSLNAKTKTCFLTKVLAGHSKHLFQKQHNLKTGKEYEISVQFNSEQASNGSNQKQSISIKIDDKNWGDHTDQSKPFTSGRIGVYCRSNNAARFKSIRVEEINSIRAPQNGQQPDAQWMSRFQPNFTTSTTPVFNPHDPATNILNNEIFSAFDATIFNEITVPSPDAVGVLVGAQVKVLNNQKFAVLGYVFTDGSFHLLSSLNLDPLRFEVAGIAVELPMEINGRLALSGRSHGADSYAQVTAQGWGIWEPIPGIARLKIASEDKPATLVIKNNLKFAAKGSVELQLFNGAATLNGQVDLSDSHCFVEGNFEYKPNHFISRTRSVELTLSGNGRIGPAAHFELNGNGALKILGRTVSDVKGTLSDRGVALEGTLTTGNWNWNGIDIKQFTMALRGMIDLSQSGPPNFLFEGDTYLRLFGTRTSANRLEVKGRGGIRAEAGNLATFVEGKLFWQGREWLQGRMLLDSKTGIHLEGHTYFGLILSPNKIGGVDVASLFFRINLGGTVNISPKGAFECDLYLDWDLGINLPGNKNQTLPLASDAIHLSGGLDQPVQLINLEGFKLLPLQGFKFSLPIPKIEGTGKPILKIGTKNNKIAINVPQLGTIYMDERELVTGLTGGSLPSLKGGTPPSLTPGTLPILDKGTLPSLNGGTLPSLDRGKLPGLSINFLKAKFTFTKGSLPSLTRGSLPSLTPGSLPSLNRGTLPSLTPGSFPTVNEGSFPKLSTSGIPFPKYISREYFDTNRKPVSIYKDYRVSWENEKISIDLSTFKSLPIGFGIDKRNYRFYVQIAQKKYALNGKLL